MNKDDVVILEEEGKVTTLFVITDRNSVDGYIQSLGKEGNTYYICGLDEEIYIGK